MTHSRDSSDKHKNSIAISPFLYQPVKVSVDLVRGARTKVVRFMEMLYSTMALPVDLLIRRVSWYLSMGIAIVRSLTLLYSGLPQLKVRGSWYDCDDGHRNAKCQIARNPGMSTAFLQPPIRLHYYLRKFLVCNFPINSYCQITASETTVSF